MHQEAYDGFARMLALSGLDPQRPWQILDVGGADVNGSVRDQFPLAIFTGLDIEPAPGVQIVADAATFRCVPVYDVVIATELWEHTERWREIILTMASALDTDGPQILIATCASTGRPGHGARGEWGVPAGQYYGNVDPEDARAELGKYFHEVHVEYNANPGDLYCWAKGRRA